LQIQNKRKVNILNVEIDNITSQEVLDIIEDSISKNKPLFIVTANVLTIAQAIKKIEYKSILENADLILADGYGIILASKILGTPIIEKISGIDLLSHIFNLSSQKGYKVFLLGAKKYVIEKAYKNLKLNYPKLNIVGYHHGYDDENVIRKKIEDTAPNIILVGMGQPKQEKWLYENLRKINSVGIGVGGSFDIISGNLKRAPKWMQFSGLEWLYRGIQEPKRFLRYFDFLLFFFKIFQQKIKLMFTKI
jgi:N-acetylglucosaminyldiphosphoundecaprenol N-acetyl-beta-D-mannosaminyltransferase